MAVYINGQKVSEKVIKTDNRYLFKTDNRCPYYTDLTEQEQTEYSMLAPTTNKAVWLSLFWGIIGGIIIIALYYSWYNNELSKFNYQFKKDIDAKRLADKKGDQ